MEPQQQGNHHFYFAFLKHKLVQITESLLDNIFQRLNKTVVLLIRSHLTVSFCSLAYV